MTSEVIVLDSTTVLPQRARGAVVVTGSHGGASAVAYALEAGVKAVVLNDGGVGKDSAGVAGLELADQAGVAAATVSHLSAQIGSGDDAFENGVISHTNETARRAGVISGMLAHDAAATLQAATLTAPRTVPTVIIREPMIVEGGERPIVICDSITQAGEREPHAVVVSGSHGGISSGHATTSPVFAAFFNDAGVGKDEAGLSRLRMLEEMGIPAATADYRSCRIGDGEDTYAHGVISHANRQARALGARSGEPVQAAARAMAASDN